MTSKSHIATFPYIFRKCDLHHIWNFFHVLRELMLCE